MNTKDEGPKGSSYETIALRKTAASCGSALTTDSLADFEADLFGIDELEPEKLRAIARGAAEKILAGM